MILLSVWRQLVPKSAPLSPDVNFDVLGQFELGASGIAAAILRGAALASQRVHKLAAKKADGEEKGASSSMATILHKDFEDAARAQVGCVTTTIACA